MAGVIFGSHAASAVRCEMSTWPYGALDEEWLALPFSRIWGTDQVLILPGIRQLMGAARVAYIATCLATAVTIVSPRPGLSLLLLLSEPLANSFDPIPDPVPQDDAGRPPSERTVNGGAKRGHVAE